MPVTWQQLYAQRAAGMRASDIREILKVTAQPDVISLAGGLPAPELFPIDEYRRAFEWILESDGAQALQYGPSEGYRPLRVMIAERLSRFGVHCTADDVLITNGSQQALDLIGKMLLDPGDAVLCERPTYLGALQAFNQYQASYVVVPMDEDGMRVDEVERALARDASGPRRIKLIYAIPNFQNPTGRSLSAERRPRLVELASRFGVPVVEDDPYGELRYEGEPLPSLKSLDSDDSVIYLGTFSKILAPGFRLGWVVAGPMALEGILHAKQPSDLHTGVAPQMATYYVARDGFIDEHVQHIKDFYRERRDVMLSALAEQLPSGAHFTHPAGGLFVWAELPAHIDTRELLIEAVQNKVDFVTGKGFNQNKKDLKTKRMNIKNKKQEQIQKEIEQQEKNKKKHKK